MRCPVRQVTSVVEMGLLSSSLDGVICIADAERAQVLHSVALHTAGVHCFAHSCAFGLVASGGLERTIRLWQARAWDAAFVRCFNALSETLRA
jgi:WD40 repeat protein